MVVQFSQRQVEALKKLPPGPSREHTRALYRRQQEEKKSSQQQGNNQSHQAKQGRNGPRKPAQAPAQRGSSTGTRVNQIVPRAEESFDAFHMPRTVPTVSLPVSECSVLEGFVRSTHTLDAAVAYTFIIPGFSRSKYAYTVFNHTTEAFSWVATAMDTEYHVEMAPCRTSVRAYPSINTSSARSSPPFYTEYLRAGIGLGLSATTFNSATVQALKDVILNSPTTKMYHGNAVLCVAMNARPVDYVRCESFKSPNMELILAGSNAVRAAEADASAETDTVHKIIFDYAIQQPAFGTMLIHVPARSIEVDMILEFKRQRMARYDPGTAGYNNRLPMKDVSHEKLRAATRAKAEHTQAVDPHYDKWKPTLRQPPPFTGGMY